MISFTTAALMLASAGVAYAVSYKGSRGANRYVGTPDSDRVELYAGNDTAAGRDGSDKLFGGPDYDKLYGEAGNDTLLGQAGSDVPAGGPGGRSWRAVLARITCSGPAVTTPSTPGR
jgi:Ca2+-binding RTX toxin-like protein